MSIPQHARRRRTSVAIATLVALAVVPATASAYTSTPGPEVANAAFTVTYKGEGTYRTRFHAHPPNPGGKDDTNDARDSSKQGWDVRYGGALAIPTCGQPAEGSADPCAKVAGLSGARGPTSITGKVDHKHVDGLYRQFDRTVKCKLAKRPSPRRRLDATLSVRYLPESQSFGLRALSPLTTAAALFPAQCAKQGDSIDRILDFYAMPGFSFAEGFGPDRWFSSREVVIPAAVFRRSSKIRVRLADTGTGTPPRRCAVHDPSFERCTTGGSWKGVMTLTRRQAATAGAVRAAAARVTAAAAKVKAPRSALYQGRRARLQMQISGKAIQIVAFEFPCEDTRGATSLTDNALKKTRRGYRFGIKAQGIVTYRDDEPDENG